MGYLTNNTQSNRVVIITSVITRIFQLCAIPGRSHFNLFNKDTRELFILCILCPVPVIIFVICLFLFIIYFFCACYLSLSFIYFVHARSHLFIVQILFFFLCSQEKRFNSDPGLCSRYFDLAYNIIYAIQ